MLQVIESPGRVLLESPRQEPRTGFCYSEEEDRAFRCGLDKGMLEVLA